MSSNRRPRGRQPDRPDDEDFDDGRAPRRDPRRRTPYTPRQRDARPPDDEFPDDYLDEPRQQRVTRRRQAQPQASSRNRTRTRPQPAEQFDYEVDDYLDEGYDDDRVIDTSRAPSSRRSRQQPARAPRGTGRAPQDDLYGAGDYADSEYDDYDDPFDDGFIDEDDWYEEEAAAGGYRPRQRSTRSVPRPSISVPRPSMPQVSLPRPTVPVAVREAALIQDRNSLVLAGVLVLSLIGMVVLTMTRIENLAPSFSTHISASGIKEDFRTEDALWQLPLMAGALLLMNLVLAWFLAQWSTFSARFVLVASIIVQVVIWVALLRLAV